MPGAKRGEHVNDISAIVDVLRTVNPRVGILLAQLIASASPCHSAIPAYTDSPVMIVDQYTGFEPATMTYDGTHPNAQGEAQMADRWFAQLAPLLDVFAAASGR